jgi:phosphomannomutase
MTTGSTPDLRARARAWLQEDPDEATRAELQALLDAGDEAQLEDRFGARLEFGTAGLRGVIGAGPNRMNRVVVIRTTAGLCEYLKREVPDAAVRGVVIGYDGRRMSREFAEDVAVVCAGYGIKAHLFADLVPTPLVAFAVKDLGAAAGVMVTASHNPPEYNGYKVYWGNGAQIIPPHDAGIAAAIDAIDSLIKIPRPILKEARAKGLVVDAPAEIEARYLAALQALARHPGVGVDLTVVYTPLHGVGERLARRALEQAGFRNVHSVPEQAMPDGAFPTVSFPNPEEKGAMDLALALAEETDADLVLANDPDADRLAVAVRDESGRWVQLTGNEVGALFGYYLLVDDPRPAQDRLVVTSIVSSPLLGVMARELGVRYEEVLTGFKWIANRALEVEAQTGARFVFGYEEALGYTVGDVVRDKDGIGAAAMFAELAGYYGASHGRSVLQQLDEVYRRFGLYASGQHNETIKGLGGAARIRQIMEGFRAAPPASICGIDVVTVTDIKTGERLDRITGERTRLALPISNVLVYGLADGSRITLRPSGTEPKIKYYFDVREEVARGEPVADARARATAKLARLMKAFVALADEAGKPAA